MGWQLQLMQHMMLQSPGRGVHDEVELPGQGVIWTIVSAARLPAAGAGANARAGLQPEAVTGGWGPASQSHAQLMRHTLNSCVTRHWSSAMFSM